jgi:hypothetical protein
MTSCTKLDVPRIEAALRAAQLSGDVNSTVAGGRRDVIEPRVISNLLAGYRFVEQLLHAGTDLFARGQSRQWLELNRVVLCGHDPVQRAESADHFAATEQRFYDEPNAGIEDLLEWYRAHRKFRPLELASGTYIRILTKPQLFIEGNHRTGALVMSYVLMRAGMEPFVLSVDNAREFFRASSEIRDVRKNSLSAYFKLPAIRRRLVEMLTREHRPAYLLGNGVLT